MSQDVESRLRKIEARIGWQRYVIAILMVLWIVDTSGELILWGERGPPNFDHIAVSLTVFQTLFGIAALYGFWALRALTRERAEEVAEREVGKIAPPLIQRQATEVLDAMRNEPPILNAQADGMAEAIGGRDDGDG